MDIYKIIEENVLSQLENGLIPWRQCYNVRSGGMAFSHSTGLVYSALNQMLLQAPGEYWTFNQAAQNGYSIRKGSKAKKIVFWKVLQYEKEDDGKAKSIPFLKWHNVFHESDIEGLPPRDLGIPQEERNRKNSESIELADKVVAEYLAATGIPLVTYDRIPCFSNGSKTIYMPEKCQFSSLHEYYAALFHEMVHSTKVKIERKMSYAREELIAEIGAAYLCGFCNIAQEDVVKNQSSYCAHWLMEIRSGGIKDLIVASSRAEQAVKLILGDKAKEIFGDAPEDKDVGQKESK